MRVGGQKRLAPPLQLRLVLGPLLLLLEAARPAQRPKQGPLPAALQGQEQGEEAAEDGADEAVGVRGQERGRPVQDVVGGEEGGDDALQAEEVDEEGGVVHVDPHVELPHAGQRLPEDHTDVHARVVPLAVQGKDLGHGLGESPGLLPDARLLRREGQHVARGAAAVALAHGLEQADEVLALRVRQLGHLLSERWRGMGWG